MHAGQSKPPRADCNYLSANSVPITPQVPVRSLKPEAKPETRHNSFLPTRTQVPFGWAPLPEGEAVPTVPEWCSRPAREFKTTWRRFVANRQKLGETRELPASGVGLPIQSSALGECSFTVWYGSCLSTTIARRNRSTVNTEVGRMHASSGVCRLGRGHHPPPSPQSPRSATRRSVTGQQEGRRSVR